MKNDTLRLTSAIEVTGRAAARLRSSLIDDFGLIQNGIAAGDNASADELRALDAFVQRYEQYLEHITQRLFPAIYRAAEYGVRPPMLRDLSIWLEEVGAIGPARDWAARIELRNRLVHEYPLEGSDRAISLNAAIEQSQAMLAEVDAVLAYVFDRQLLGPMP